VDYPIKLDNDGRKGMWILGSSPRMTLEGVDPPVKPEDDGREKEGRRMTGKKEGRGKPKQRGKPVILRHAESEPKNPFETGTIVS